MHGSEIPRREGEGMVVGGVLCLGGLGWVGLIFIILFLLYDIILFFITLYYLCGLLLGCW